VYRNLLPFRLSAMVKSYRGSGSASYHPAMLLGPLIYGYATRAFSSRAIDRATYDSVAFRYIAGNDHPDHDTIAPVEDAPGQGALCAAQASP
jgi:transposase